jgi:hypothetical protein
MAKADIEAKVFKRNSMEIKFGLISSDSHRQLDKDAYTNRMSKTKGGDRIPHVIEVREEKFDFLVERWIVNGVIQGGTSRMCRQKWGAPMPQIERKPDGNDR